MTDPPSYHEASSTTNATTAANTTPHTACSRTIPDSDIFPTLESLAFPDRLLGQKPPYVLILEVENRVRIRMNSNHTPSLELIKAYFEKHTRRDNRVHTLVSQSISLHGTRILHVCEVQGADHIIGKPARLFDSIHPWSMLATDTKV